MMMDQSPLSETVPDSVSPDAADAPAATADEPLEAAEALAKDGIELLLAVGDPPERIEQEETRRTKSVGPQGGATQRQFLG